MTPDIANGQVTALRDAEGDDGVIPASAVAFGVDDVVRWWRADDGAMTPQVAAAIASDWLHVANEPVDPAPEQGKRVEGGALFHDLRVADRTVEVQVFDAALSVARRGTEPPRETVARIEIPHDADRVLQIDPNAMRIVWLD